MKKPVLPRLKHSGVCYPRIREFLTRCWFIAVTDPTVEYITKDIPDAASTDAPAETTAEEDVPTETILDDTPSETAAEESPVETAVGVPVETTAAEIPTETGVVEQPEETPAAEVPAETTATAVETPIAPLAYNPFIPARYRGRRAI